MFLLVSAVFIASPSVYSQDSDRAARKDTATRLSEIGKRLELELGLATLASLGKKGTPIFAYRGGQDMALVGKVSIPRIKLGVSYSINNRMNIYFNSLTVKDGPNLLDPDYKLRTNGLGVQFKSAKERESFASFSVGLYRHRILEADLRMNTVYSANGGPDRYFMSDDYITVRQYETQYETDTPDYIYRGWWRYQRTLYGLEFGFGYHWSLNEGVDLIARGIYRHSFKKHLSSSMAPDTEFGPRSEWVRRESVFLGSISISVSTDHLLNSCTKVYKRIK